MDIQLSQYREEATHMHFVRGACRLPNHKLATVTRTIPEHELVSAALTREEIFNNMRDEVCAVLIRQYFKE